MDEDIDSDISYNVLDNLSKKRKRLDIITESCPCLHTTPCDERCSCVNPFSSFGCRRCCTYGSKEQQKKTAEYLVKKIDA